MEIRRISLSIVFGLCIYPAFSIDSLRISLHRKIFHFKKSDYELNLQLVSLDSAIYLTKRKSVFHVLDPNLDVCKYSDRIFIFVEQNDTIQSIIRNSDALISKRMERKFGRKLRKGIFQMNVSDYGLKNGNYKIYIVYFSRKFNICLKSNKVELIVED